MLNILFINKIKYKSTVKYKSTITGVLYYATLKRHLKTTVLLLLSRTHRLFGTNRLKINNACACKL